MATKRINELNETSALGNGDYLVSDTGSGTKKINVSNFKETLGVNGKLDKSVTQLKTIRLRGTSSNGSVKFACPSYKFATYLIYGSASSNAFAYILACSNEPSRTKMAAVVPYFVEGFFSVTSDDGNGNVTINIPQNASLCIVASEYDCTATLA